MERYVMRVGLSIVFSLLIVALLVCKVLTKRAKKAISPHVSFLLSGMIVPVLGNLIIILSSDHFFATAGYYIYFIGMDLAVYSIWRFAYAYCELGKPKRYANIIVHSLLTLDLVQYILNPFWGKSFSTEKILIENKVYFRLVPLIGQTYHRVICYGLFASTLIIFIVMTVKSAKVYRSKYSVILFSMAATGAVETYYIVSRHPFDMSMIGFGLLGLMVYYFAIVYRPLKVLDRLLASMASEMPEALFFFDVNGKCIWTNEPGRKLVGVLGDNYDNIKDNLNYLFEDIDFNSSGWIKRVTRGYGEETQYLYMAMRSAADDKGNINGSYLSIRDITDEQLELKQEMYNATHDSLTGLYTKEYLFENIAQRLSQDTKSRYMVGYFELSNFKLINDVFGRQFGTIAIKQVAKYIQENSSPKSLYGRISSDSFGMLMNMDLFDQQKVQNILDGFIVKDENMEHHIVIHLGLCEVDPQGDIDVQILFDSARLATTSISNRDKAQIVYYDDKLRNEIIHDQLISNQVKNAIATRQIRPYLQPIVDSLGMIAGAEALVRWIHPEEGFMSPGQFIPLFERNGMIADVDKHMWRCACEILSEWKQRGIECFISINVSPKDFYCLDVVAELTGLVEEFDIDPAKLRVEITETTMIGNSFDMTKLISDLRNYGFIVEMDDFGSGYSSLNLLKDMPLDVIKIDMQFLKDSERNIKAGMIIKNIINMSDDLGIDTLTEGVETAKQFELLYDMGCKLYQGYYFSKPVPREDFEKQWFE